VKRVQLSVTGSMTLVMALAVGFASLRYASPLWAGSVLLLTLAGLSLAILAAVYLKHGARAYWAGFALLGWGYLILARGVWWSPEVGRPDLITTALLDRLYPLLAIPDPLDKKILAALDKQVPIPFTQSVALGDALHYVQGSTRDDSLPSGVPIYLHPEEGFTKAVEKSRVTLSMEGIPLKTTLGLLLRQAGMTYRVQEGMLVITSNQRERDVTDGFHRAGHCYFALLAGCLGGIAGRSLHDRGMKAAR
jgi:hypothetical protein